MSVTSDVLSWIVESGCRKGDWGLVQAAVQSMDHPVVGTASRLLPVSIALCSLKDISFASYTVYVTITHLLDDLPKHIRAALGINVELRGGFFV